MSYKVFALKHFQREIKFLAKKYRSIKEDLAGLVQQIQENPTAGDMLKSGLYKIRMPIQSKGKGKRGGARVIYYLITTDEEIWLLSVYDKSEKETLTNDELDLLLTDLSIERQPDAE